MWGGSFNLRVTGHARCREQSAGFAGGYLADKLSARFDDRRWYMYVSGISTVLLVPFQLVAYLHGDLWAVIGSLFVVSILGGMFLGPSFAIG